MGAPASGDDLKNLALLQLMVGPLTSFANTDDNRATVANLVYDQVRQELLQNHTWHFATQRASISLDSTKIPAFDYLGAYTLPANCLKLHHIGTEYDQWWNKEQYDIKAGVVFYPSAYSPANVYSNSTSSTPPNTVYVEYTEDVTDVTQMRPLFRRALYLRMAAEMALPLCGDPKVQQLNEARAIDALREAIYINHQERFTRVVERDPIAQARQIDGSLADMQIRVPDDAWPTS